MERNVTCFAGNGFTKQRLACALKCSRTPQPSRSHTQDKQHPTIQPSNHEPITSQLIVTQNNTAQCTVQDNTTHHTTAQCTVQDSIQAQHSHLWPKQQYAGEGAANTGEQIRAAQQPCQQNSTHRNRNRNRERERDCEGELPSHRPYHAFHSTLLGSRESSNVAPFHS